MDIIELNKEQAEVFDKYFLENGEFVFEGCWLRNQRPENASKSGYVDSSTARRRYIHFYDTYVDNVQNGKHFLALKNYYLYVTNTLPKEEIDEYLSKIMVAIKNNGYKQIGENVYLKGTTKVEIKLYDVHPKNRNEFPNNYKSCDIIISSNGYDYTAIYERMWNLTKKMYRMPDKRGNPTYTKDVKDIIKYLPAQIEMGCGPSISANIPPLYEMHETYKVQNHITGKFYFASADNLILSVIEDEPAMRLKFAQVPLKCISAKHTEGYEYFNKLYKQGYFKGVVYNNNFDRLVKRFDIKEKILRIYDYDTYYTITEFESDVKSLISMGCHADRRQIERQAREHGLKVIFIDIEGFCNKDGFESYPLEGPQDNDIILNISFEQAMKELYDELNSKK